MLWVALAYAAGALLALAHVGPAGWVGAGGALGGLIVASRSPGRRGSAPRRSGLVSVVCVLAGALNASAVLRDPLARCLRERAAGAFVAEGRFEGYADLGPTHFRIEVGPCAGAEARTLAQDVHAVPGARVRVRGWWRRTDSDPAGWLIVRSSEPLSTPPGGAWAYRLRAAGLAASAERFGRAAPLMDALLFARRERIPPDVREAFARAGVAHLLAISGFHVGVVGVVLYGALLLAPLTAATRMSLTVAAVWAYVGVIGFPGAATRAAVFLCTAAWVRARGRPTLGTAPLSGAALLMLAVRPEWAASVGLQLSFAGMLGLILWRRPLVRWLEDTPVPAPLASSLAATLAATAATLPLVAWHFGEVSLVGVPVSLLLTPFAGVVIVSGVLTLTLGLVLPPLAPALGQVTAWGASGLARGVEWVASFEWAAQSVSKPQLAVTAVAVAAVMRATRRGTVPVRVLALAAALTGAPTLLRALQEVGGRGELDLYVLDVGQGDAIAVRSPRGRWLLVDSGGRGRSFDAGRDRIVPFLTDHGVEILETLVLSHADLDHSGGAQSVLAALEVRSVIDPGVAAASSPYLDVLRSAHAERIPWVPARSGQVLDFDGVRIEVLSPATADADASLNDGSVVLLLRYGSFEALLTGDISAEVERSLLPLLPSELEVLKVAHHGSATSTSWDLLEATRPELAVISVGRRNRYGHPDGGVMARLNASGARILRTDRNGTVRVRVDAAGRWRVRRARGASGEAFPDGSPAR
ncbi:MAG: DNA internalization-related competence protein ComEC/Rec2 [Gemmatimonadota bacterium]